MYQKTHYEDALILANNILELDRNESTSYQIVGKIYSLMKHYRKAIYNFIRAIDCRSKRIIGKDYVLQDGDIIKIVAGS